jgi:hypothetical protein
MAGFSSDNEPEGPHNTTAVLSAKEVYHRFRNVVHLDGLQKQIHPYCVQSDTQIESFLHRAVSAIAPWKAGR